MYSGDGGGADDGGYGGGEKKQVYETSEFKTEEHSEGKIPSYTTARALNIDHDIPLTQQSQDETIPLSKDDTITTTTSPLSFPTPHLVDTETDVKLGSLPTSTDSAPTHVSTDASVSSQQHQPPSDSKAIPAPPPSPSSTVPAASFNLATLLSYMKNNTTSTTTSATTTEQVENDGRAQNEKGFNALLSNITSLFFGSSSASNNNNGANGYKASGTTTAATHAVVLEENISASDTLLSKSGSDPSQGPSSSEQTEPSALPLFHENQSSSSITSVSTFTSDTSVSLAHIVPSSLVTETSTPAHTTMTMTAEASHTVSEPSSSSPSHVITDAVAHTQTHAHTQTKEVPLVHASFAIESMSPRLVDTSISALPEEEQVNRVAGSIFPIATVADKAVTVAAEASAEDSTALVGTHMETDHRTDNTPLSAEVSSAPAVAFISTQNFASPTSVESIRANTADSPAVKDATSITNTLPPSLPTPPSTTTTFTNPTPSIPQPPLPQAILTGTNRLLITLDEIHAVVDFNAGTRTGAIKRTSDQLLPMELAGKSCVYVLLITHEVGRQTYVYFVFLHNIVD